MTTLTRQDLQRDLQTKLDQAMVKMCQRLATKQDLLTMGDAIRDRMLVTFQDLFQQQTQQVFRQMTWHMTQMNRRMQFVETRLAVVEHDLKLATQALTKLAEIQAQSLQLSLSQQQHTHAQPRQPVEGHTPAAPYYERVAQ